MLKEPHSFYKGNPTFASSLRPPHWKKAACVPSGKIWWEEGSETLIGRWLDSNKTNGLIQSFFPPLFFPSSFQQSIYSCFVAGHCFSFSFASSSVSVTLSFSCPLSSSTYHSAPHPRYHYLLPTNHVERWCAKTRSAPKSGNRSPCRQPHGPTCAHPERKNFKRHFQHLYG